MKSVGIDIGNGKAIIEEGEMKRALFQRAADTLIVIGRHKILRCGRMPPGCGEIRAVLRLQKSNERHLA